MLKPHGFVITIPHMRNCFRFFEKKLPSDFFQSRLWRDQIRLRRTPFVITGDNVKLQA